MEGYHSTTVRPRLKRLDHFKNELSSLFFLTARMLAWNWASGMDSFCICWVEVTALDSDLTSNNISTYWCVKIVLSGSSKASDKYGDMRNGNNWSQAVGTLLAVNTTHMAIQYTKGLIKFLHTVQLPCWSSVLLSQTLVPNARAAAPTATPVAEENTAHVTIASDIQCLE